MVALTVASTNGAAGGGPGEKGRIRATRMSAQKCASGHELALVHRIRDTVGVQDEGNEHRQEVGEWSVGRAIDRESPAFAGDHGHAHLQRIVVV